MIVYADRQEAVDTRAALRALLDEVTRLRGREDRALDDARALLIRAGAVESAVSDALHPEHDDDHELERHCRRVTIALAELTYCAWRGASGHARIALAAAANALERLLSRELPARVRLAPAEGYAYYALYPEMYMAAAERLTSVVGANRVVCIGIRSIGTSLAAGVEAVLRVRGCEPVSVTVRPRGHPFDRELRLAPGLARCLADARDAYFVVVDEGPGLSGSSFAAVARGLETLGVRAERVILMPSWVTDGSCFRSSAARERWQKHRKVVGSFEDVWLASGALARDAGCQDLTDVGAGAWRSRVYDDAESYPAVEPRHERQKFVARREGEPVVLRFAGLGARGRAALERARLLADAGLGAAPGGLHHGFLVLPWVEGRPLLPDECDGSLLDAMAEHLAFVRAMLPSRARTPVERVLEMVRVNVAEGLGEPWTERLRALEPMAAESGEQPAVAVDGRMLPHEWIRSGERLLKVDALDHHDDHFFPGCQEIAWDLAGAIAEWSLPDDAARGLVRRYEARSGDAVSEARLRFNEVAYLAYRLGYVTLARESLTRSDDAGRFAALQRRYASALARALERPPTPGRAVGHVTTPGLENVRVLILDADGTLRRTTVDGQPCPHAPDEWELLPGVRARLDAMPLERGELRLAVASNQDHVGYGLVSEAMARRLLADAVREATRGRVASPVIRLCPHVLEVACECRKPAPGMLLEILAECDVPATQALFVGDTEGDREAAARAGVRFMWAKDFFQAHAR
jgi:histidinol-phosphate phosphatase family protein